MYLHYLKLPALLLCGFLLSSCATVLTGSTQSVHIKVLNATNQKLLEDVRCEVEDSGGRIFYMETNPGSVKVTKGQGSLIINCFKKGFVQSQLDVGSGVNPWTALNVVFWPGLIADASSGATERYPSHITIMMKPH